MPTTARSASRDKVRAHRTRLREAGLRPVQIWVPDVRSKSFALAAHRQSLAVAKSPHAKRDQSFVDAISAWNEE
ncbi:MAG: antitoxin MazE family protein [Acidobacteriota bacterium]